MLYLYVFLQHECSYSYNRKILMNMNELMKLELVMIRSHSRHHNYSSSTKRNVENMHFSVIKNNVSKWHVKRGISIWRL